MLGGEHDVDPCSVQCLSLLTGCGGIELGLQLVVPGVRPVCYVEREAYAASLLVERIHDGWLPDAPVWTDVTTFDPRPWRGRVDIITGGIPCQPWSSAGHQRGTEDERWIWGSIHGIIEEVRPEWCFFECTLGLRSGGLQLIARDLAASGYDLVWTPLSAGAVGAPHQRRRLWILAGLADADRAGQSRERQPRVRHGAPGGDVDGCHGQGRAVAHANGGSGAAERGERSCLPASREEWRAFLAGGHGAAEWEGSAGGTGEAGAGELGGVVDPDGGGRQGQTGVQAGEPEPDRTSPDMDDAEGTGQLRAATDEDQEEDHAGGRGCDVANAGDVLEDAAREQSHGTGEHGPGGRGEHPDPGSQLDDAGGQGSQGGRDEGSTQPADPGGERSLPPGYPPRPDNREGWGIVLDQWPELAPTVESALRGVASGSTPRVGLPEALVEDWLVDYRPDQLRTVGNSVAPACAALAFIHLVEELRDYWRRGQ